MAFLDNIKISVKIISAVILLALVSAGLLAFSGMTMNHLDREYGHLLENDAQARVELARVTRRVAELGYYALAVITYAPDLAEAKKSATEIEELLQGGRQEPRIGPEIQPAPQGRV